MNTVNLQKQAGQHEAEQQRNAFNVAFNELGLDWFWDADTHRSLHETAKTKDPVKHYIETQRPHLLKAYDADFLANAIHSVKQSRLGSIGAQ
jgi:hypothetical protein